MRTVLGRANSSNVMKVVWLLEELGLPYERRDIGGPFGGNGTAEYLAMNPTGGIPTLVEGDFVLWESNAILRYLCAANAPGHSMWPDDVHARASIDRWMDFQQTSLGPPQTVVFQGLVRTPPERRDLAAIERAKADAARRWSMLDHVLGVVPYVAGPVMTLADIAIGVHAHRWFAFDMERPAQPHLRAWYDGLLTRPAYTAYVALPMT